MRREDAAETRQKGGGERYTQPGTNARKKCLRQGRTKYGKNEEKQEGQRKKGYQQIKGSVVEDRRKPRQ